MGGLTIEETAEKQDAASKASDKGRRLRLVRVAKAIVPDWNEV